MDQQQDEEEQLRSVALQNATSILAARRRAEEELVAAKEALRETADRLRAVFEQAAVGIAIADLDGQFLEVNERFLRIVGYSREEFLSLTVESISYPDDMDLTRRYMRELVSGLREDYSQEKRYVRKDGSLVWSRTNITLLRDHTGTANRFIGVIEDVTERRRAEEALRRSEQFSRSIIESSRDCLKTLTLDGELLWISDNGRKALCLPEELDVVGKSWFTFWSPEDVPAVQAAVRNAIASGEGNFVGAFAINGRMSWWNVLITPIRGADGLPERLLAISRNITERKLVEQALQDETRVLEILNRTGAALASKLDVQLLLQEVTDAATEISGAQFGAFFYNTTDASGDAFLLYALSGAPREAFEQFGHPRATDLFGPTFRGEGVIRCDDVLEDPRYGKWAPHHGMPPGHLPVRSYLAVPVVSRSGEVIGGLFFGHATTGVFSERVERLVTGIAAQAAVAIDNARLYEATHKAAEERQQLLESERHARAEAERASAMKDEFLATLSHELRTPLNAILGWSQLLRIRSMSEAEFDRGMETIERNARMQTQLIEDLLDMSRINAGKMRLDIQRIFATEFIESAIDAVRPAAEGKGIRLQRVLDPTAGPIAGDAGRLQQVIWNLLSNAIKFTPRGGTVQVSTERVNSHVEITVADDGIGVAPEFLPFMFDRFRQADSTTTRVVGGLGLGLSIVKHLVELHGGSVQCSSAGLGQGTTFTVLLPLSIMHRPASKISRTHPTQELSVTAFARSNLQGVRVLVVDDSVDARDLITRVLQECDADVQSTSSARDALALVEQFRPHVVVSDIGMPEVDGYQFVRLLRALGPERGGNVPAIALTAFARSEDRTRALRAGYLVHISKPIDASELVATVASVMGRTDDS